MPSFDYTNDNFFIVLHLYETRLSYVGAALFVFAIFWSIEGSNIA